MLCVWFRNSCLNYSSIYLSIFLRIILSGKRSWSIEQFCVYFVKKTFIFSIREKFIWFSDIFEHKNKERGLLMFHLVFKKVCLPMISTRIFAIVSCLHLVISIIIDFSSMKLYFLRICLFLSTKTKTLEFLKIKNFNLWWNCNFLTIEKNAE